MLVVTGRITARPDTFETLREAAIAHTVRSRAEPGCLRHSVHVDCEDPLTLFFYEEWSDRAALDAHFAQEGSHDFMRAVRDLSASSTRVKILPIVDRA
jgi:quinol monooxygenase YgiN